MSKKFLQILSLSAVVLLGLQVSSEAVTFTYTENYSAQTKGDQPKELTILNFYSQEGKKVSINGQALINLKSIHIKNQPLTVTWKNSINPSLPWNLFMEIALYNKNSIEVNSKVVKVINDTDTVSIVRTGKNTATVEVK